jgi:DNA-3-methyladenine glycosylase II
MTPEHWQQAKAHLAKHDKVLKKIIVQYDGELMVKKGDAFLTLCRAIVGQQISVKAADSIWARFEAAVGTVSPKQVLAAETDALRACGLSGSKVIYLHALAEHFIQNQAVIRRWPELPDDTIIAELTSIKGIGRWTAEMYLIFHLGRPDVLPLGDIGLLKAIYKHYNNAEKLPLSEVRKLAERWQPYRSVATWYLWRSLDPVPVAY